VSNILCHRDTQHNAQQGRKSPTGDKEKIVKAPGKQGRHMYRTRNQNHAELVQVNIQSLKKQFNTPKIPVKEMISNSSSFYFW
jgi:hypothetical protein